MAQNSDKWQFPTFFLHFPIRFLMFHPLFLQFLSVFPMFSLVFLPVSYFRSNVFQYYRQKWFELTTGVKHYRYFIWDSETLQALSENSEFEWSSIKNGTRDVNFYSRNWLVTSLYSKRWCKYSALGFNKAWKL